MRKLLKTLFVINEDAYLTLDGENLVVTPPAPCTAPNRPRHHIRRDTHRHRNFGKVIYFRYGVQH